MINKQLIQQSIIQGNLSLAINMLLKLTNAHDKSMYNEAIMLSARFNALSKEINMGMIDDSSAKTNQARINYSITQMLNQVPDDWAVSN